MVGWDEFPSNSFEIFIRMYKAIQSIVFSINYKVTSLHLLRIDFLELIKCLATMNFYRKKEQ